MDISRTVFLCRTGLGLWMLAVQVVAVAWLVTIIFTGRDFTLLYQFVGDLLFKGGIHAIIMPLCAFIAANMILTRVIFTNNTKFYDIKEPKLANILQKTAMVRPKMSPQDWIYVFQPWPLRVSLSIILAWAVLGVVSLLTLWSNGHYGPSLYKMYMFLNISIAAFSFGCGLKLGYLKIANHKKSLFILTSGSAVLLASLMIGSYIFSLQRVVDPPAYTQGGIYSFWIVMPGIAGAIVMARFARRGSAGKTLREGTAAACLFALTLCSFSISATYPLAAWIGFACLAGMGYLLGKMPVRKRAGWFG